MSWFYLSIAVVFEIATALCIDRAQGFTHFRWTAGAIGAGVVAAFSLSVALLSLNVGVAYAIWTGASSAGIALCSVLFLGAHLEAKKLVGITIIVAGVAGLHMASGG